MKQTRRSQIRQRIFRLDDLKRIAGVFNDQARLAKKSDHHHSVGYSLHFSDDTSFEADTPALLDETAVAVKRPVKVLFRFCNYTLGRHMDFSITHGNSDYGNGFWIESDEEAWLNDNFTKLDGFVKGTEAQMSWCARHPAILANLLALGIGSLGMLLMDVFFAFLEPPQINLSQARVKSLRDFIIANQLWFYLLGWFWRWLAGWFWGAIPAASWLLSAWPNIELDFGADHLKIEKKRRDRIAVTIALIVVPVLLTIIQDIIRKTI